MTDPVKRVDRLDEQAMALVASLEELLVGRPLDVVIDALAAVASRRIILESDLTIEEIEYEVWRAMTFVQEAICQVVGPTRRDRLKFALYLAHCLTLCSVVINHPEGKW